MDEEPPENRYLAALLALQPEGLTRNAWTSRAGVNRSFFQDLKQKGRVPRTPSLEKVLAAIGMTVAEFYAYLQTNQYHVPLPAPPGPAPVPPPAPTPTTPLLVRPTMEFRGADRPRDVPVMGISECANEIEVTVDDQVATIETALIDWDEVVDHLRRPLALDSRAEVYGIYQQGHSLEPKYEHGEPVYVDARKPPMIGDYVVVQLRTAGQGDRVSRVISKRLVRNTSAYVELEQFNPPLVFRIAKSEIVRMHRIIPPAELISF